MKRAFWSVSTVSGKCTSISPMGFPSLPNTSLVGRSELKGGLLGREGRLETVIVEKRTYTHTVEDFDKEFLHRVKDSYRSQVRRLLRLKTSFVRAQ